MEIGAARVGRGVPHGFGLRAHGVGALLKGGSALVTAKLPYSRRVGRCGFGMLLERDWMRCVAGPLPYSICQSVNIASTEERITTGYRRHAGIAGVGVRTVRSALKNTGSAESAGSVGIPDAVAGGMGR
jgi:hypothetical protein